MSTDFSARPEISLRFAETSSMDFCTCAMDAVPCSTAEAWLCACSATWSTEAVSSSTEALVCSRVEAWLWAPSASFCALAVISSLEEATCSALFCTVATMLAQLHRHAVQRLGEHAHLVLLPDVQLPREIPAGHELCKGHAL